MFYDVERPDITLLEWERFYEEFPPHLIEDVIDRDEARLPKWFVPLARGVAIASDALLRKVGHRPGMRRPRGWRETSPEYFVWNIDWNSSLVVRESDETGLWTVERLGKARRHVDDTEILVHPFGSTPIFTRSYQSAMRLAMHCHVNGPPSDLRWIKTIPTNCEAAIEFARKRRIDVAIGANNAQPDGQLH